jgi:ATP-dependent DNA helicase RecG
MTQPEEISTILDQGEGPNLIFVKEKVKLDELAEALVALANAHGGTVLMGVSGRAKGKVEGLSDPAAAREKALTAALICTPPLILPLPELLTFEGSPLLLLSVPPGLPHVYSLHGKYLRREGLENAPLLPELLRQLFIERGDVSWERTIPPDVAFDELDPHKIAAYTRRLGSAVEDNPLAWLVRRGCLVERRDGETNQLIPTHAGLLLFAREVERRFPQAEITLVHYRGREPADEFEREDVRDTLPEAIRRAERWLIEHMRKGSRMIGLERQDWVQFPTAAVREALVNAVAHRDYSVRGEGIRIALFADRLEVYSPGRLPGHVTLDNLVQERFSRNEALVQVLADQGMIERLGYGIDRMLRQMELANLPPPTFRETAAGFLVVLQGQGYDDVATSGIDTRELVRQGLNERQIAAVVLLNEQRRISNGDLQELHPDVSAETIRRDLADLVERGLLLKVGEKRATYYILK